MIATPSELLAALAERGLVDARRRGPAADVPAGRPWYIGLLLGTAAWFAGLFFMFFVFALVRPDQGSAGFVIGPVLLFIAYALFWLGRDGVFLAQSGLVFSVAGQFAILAALLQGLMRGSAGANGIATVALVAILLQVALLFLMPNRLHRTMSALFATCAWATLVRYGLWDRSTWNARAGLDVTWHALLGWMLVWPPIGGLLAWLVSREPAWMAAGWQEVARPAATGLIVGLALGTLISEPFDMLASTRWDAQSWIAVWPLLGAIAAIGAMAAAFALGQRALMSICVIAALGHLSHFYYAMGVPLLTKAAMMAAMGIGCLATAHVLRRTA